MGSKGTMETMGLAAALAGTLLASACTGNSGGSSGGSSGGNADAGNNSDGITSTSIAIGTTIPLTGPAASVCKPVSDAANAWFDSVNASGGINGRKIDATVLDDAYTAPKALANAQQLVRKPVFAIFNGCGTIQPPAIQQAALPAGVPFLFPLASLATGDTSNAFFIVPTYDKQMAALITYGMKKNGPGSVYVIAQQLPGVDKTISAIQSATAAAGGTVVGNDETTGGQADLTPVVLKLKAAKPDYLALVDGVNAGRLVTLMQSQGALPTKNVLAFSNSTESILNGKPNSETAAKLLAPAAVAPPNTEQTSRATTCLRARRLHS